MFKVLQKDFNLAEYKREVYRLEVDSTVGPEDLLAPECWSHIVGSKNPKVGTIIEVFPRDAGWYLELLVRGKLDAGLRVAILRHVEFDAVKPEKDDGDSDYEIKYRGRAKWSLIRKSDKVVVFEGGETREDAEKKIADLALA